MTPTLSRDRLEEIYNLWNRTEYISPDPLETLAPYAGVRDREVAALLAASLAYGRVNALLVPLKRALAVMGDSPADYVRSRTEGRIAADMDGIVHRFAKPVHLAALLAGAGTAAGRLGSLEAAFLEGYSGGVSRGGGNRAPAGDAVPRPGAASRGGGNHPAAGDAVPRPGAASRGGDIMAGLKTMEQAVRSGADADPGHLLIDPAKGSACKRLFLFLRWMVRRDDVDPGGWDSVSAADLMLPLDTWTHRIAGRAGWTQRKAADLRTVREVTSELAILNPDDPVKYDFALSRFGIRSGLNLDILFDTY